MRPRNGRAPARSRAPDVWAYACRRVNPPQICLSFSRRVRPSYARNFRPKGAGALKKRGRREDRVRAAPAVPCAKVANKNAHEHTGSAEAIRPSLRDGLRLIPCSPRRDQSLFVTVAPRKRELPENLTPAIGASGPHDFAVRERLRSSFASSTSTASHRACRDVRNAPLIGRDGVVLKCIG